MPLRWTKMINTRSISFRLTAWYAGLVVGVFGLLGLIAYLGLRYYLVSNLRDLLSRRAQIIGERLVRDIGDKGVAYVSDQIGRCYTPEINDRFYRVTRTDGLVIYHSGVPQDGSFNPTVAPVDLRIEQALMRRVELPHGNQLLIYTLPFVAGNGEHFIIESGAPENQIENALNGFLLLLCIGTPVLLGVAIAGGAYLVRHSLKPVDELRRSAEDITLHNISQRLPVVQTGDALERLAVALNQMITRLEESFHQVTRFTADASHELRTPLTVLQGELESIIQKHRLGPETYNAIGSALEETERLTKVVEGLLAISRLDAGEARLEQVRVDLADLTDATVEQMRLLAEDKSINLICRVQRPAFVTGDRSRLKQVVVNLLDNAIKYVSDGGTVVVSVEHIEHKVILEVVDNGPGIPSDVLPHVFERFFRADRARSRQVEGAGLGLSIVKSICIAHGGQVSVSSNEGQGSVFRVELPLASKSLEFYKAPVEINV